MIGGLRQREPVALHRHPSAAPAPHRMLLLHGLANSASVWDRYLRAARATDGGRWQYLTADMPWSGERVGLSAGRPEPERWLDVALAAAHEPVDVLVAHSYAAVLTLLRLGQEPSLLARHGVRGVVFVSPFFRASAEDFAWDDMSRSIDGFQALMAEGIRVHTDGRVPAEHRNELARRVRDRVGPSGWTDFFRSYLALPQVALAAIDVDCLVVTAADDTAAPPVEGERLARRLPRAQLRTVPGCGHFLMSQRPEAFRDALDPFTTRLTTGAVTR